MFTGKVIVKFLLCCIIDNGWKISFSCQIVRLYLLSSPAALSTPPPPPLLVVCVTVLAWINILNVFTFLLWDWPEGSNWTNMYCWKTATFLYLAIQTVKPAVKESEEISVINWPESSVYCCLDSYLSSVVAIILMLLPQLSLSNYLVQW